jgi:hypothetical protein
MFCGLSASAADSSLTLFIRSVPRQLRMRLVAHRVHNVRYPCAPIRGKAPLGKPAVAPGGWNQLTIAADAGHTIHRHHHDHRHDHS